MIVGVCVRDPSGGRFMERAYLLIKSSIQKRQGLTFWRYDRCTASLRSLSTTIYFFATFVKSALIYIYACVFLDRCRSGGGEIGNACSCPDYGKSVSQMTCW
jgi:hypothetical protein